MDTTFDFNNDKEKYVDKKTVEALSRELSAMITNQIEHNMTESKCKSGKPKEFK